MESLPLNWNTSTTTWFKENVPPQKPSEVFANVLKRKKANVLPVNK